MPRKISKPLQARLRRVRIFLCDVDGVLTDGSIYITSDSEIKQFSIQDGLGMILLRREGIKTGWISARYSPITTRRATELKIDFLSQEKTGKVAAVEKILAETGFGWDEICFVGDDVVDLAVFKRAGLAVAVANAIPEAKAMAHYVTQARGGHGAVREVVTLILRAQKKWARLVKDYTL